MLTLLFSSAAARVCRCWLNCYYFFFVFICVGLRSNSNCFIFGRIIGNDIQSLRLMQYVTYLLLSHLFHCLLLTNRKRSVDCNPNGIVDIAHKCYRAMAEQQVAIDIYLRSDYANTKMCVRSEALEYFTCHSKKKKPLENPLEAIHLKYQGKIIEMQ